MAEKEISKYIIKWPKGDDLSCLSQIAEWRNPLNVNVSASMERAGFFGGTNKKTAVNRKQKKEIGRCVNWDASFHSNTSQLGAWLEMDCEEVKKFSCAWFQSNTSPLYDSRAKIPGCDKWPLLETDCWLLNLEHMICHPLAALWGCHSVHPTVRCDYFTCLCACILITGVVHESNLDFDSWKTSYCSFDEVWVPVFLLFVGKTFFFFMANKS